MRSIATLLLGLLGLLLVTPSGHGQAADPALLRASLATSDAWVGQRVTVNLELLVRGTFAGVPAFDLPSVPGVVLIPPAVSPVLGSETLEGLSYTSQLHRIAVFAQRPGELVIPPITARFSGAASPGSPPTDYRLASPPLHLTTRMPPGAEALGTIISSTGLTVRETWQPRPGGAAEVGDAFTRTVRLQAPDVPGMAFPPLRFPGVEGVAVYPGQPTVQDHSERGRNSGERAETVTYVLERPGTFTLPAIVLRWWNLDRRALIEERLPAQRFEVAGPETASSVPTVQEPVRPFQLKLLLPAAAIPLLLAAAAAVAAWLRSRHRDPDAQAFAAFRAACRRGESRETYATLTAWRIADRRAAEEVDPALTAAIAALEAALFAPDTADRHGWEPTRLLELVRAERRLHRPRRAWRRRMAPVSALAPLNPGQEAQAT